MIVGALIGGTTNMTYNCDPTGSFKQNFRYFAVGAAAGAAGSGAGAAVGSAISVGGFLGGAISGGASGFAGGFVSGSGNAWVNGANAGQGIKAGLISGGISGLSAAFTGGTIQGLNDYSNGFDFWDGSRISKYSLGMASNSNLYKKMANNYNSSSLAEMNDVSLQERLFDEFGIQKGDYGLNKISTKVPEKYGLTSAGDYIDMKTGELVGGIAKLYSNGNQTLNISFRFSNADIVSFRAVAGHELIHVFHNYTVYPNIEKGIFYQKAYDLFTERVAHQSTISTYLSNGYFTDGLSAMRVAITNNFFGNYPGQYKIPSVLRFSY
jgi:hypothetical protein